MQKDINALHFHTKHTCTRVSPNSDSKSESSLSHGFMSHGFIGKKVVDGQFFVADGLFFAVGLFFIPFSPDM